MTMQRPLPLLPLAPRPARQSAGTRAEEEPVAIHHSEEEWLAVYPHLERMYVRERRRLRYVINEMQEVYNFSATPHMYKKRFAKWGFSKNERRVRSDTERISDLARSGTAAKPRRAYTVPKVMEQARLVPSPRLSYYDSANLAFLTSIRTWSSNFFETGELGSLSRPDSTKNCLVGPYRPKGTKVYDPEMLSSTFRVVACLLAQGRGVLAGRLARKAFLHIEGILEIEGPLYVWNILELLYSMAAHEQTNLFRMLIGHLTNLARNRFPESHPAMQMTCNLQKLIETCRRDSLPFQTAALEQAWSLNANLLLDNFDSRLLLLYYRLVWDTKLVNLPAERLSSVYKWLSDFHAYAPADGSYEDIATDIHNDLEPLNGNEVLEAPENYGNIKDEAFATIRHLSTLEFKDIRVKIHIMLSLIKTRAFARNCTSSGGVSKDTEAAGNTMVALLDARLLAHIVKTIGDVEAELGVDKDTAIDRARNFITLRDYRQCTFDPQIVHELWQLEGLLMGKGRLEEARDVRKDAYRRLEEYLNNIPVNRV